MCPLCQREGCRMERHHLKTRRKDKSETEDLCSECHKTIHGLFSNTELRDERLGLDTVEGLLADERVSRAVAFIARQPAGTYIRMRESNHRKRKRGKR